MPTSKNRRKKKNPAKNNATPSKAAASSRVYSVAQALTIASQLHQEGRLREAEGFYKKILAHSPTHSGALHYFGILRHQRGDSDDGVRMISQAIAASPNDPDMRNNLGNVLREAGRTGEALAAYEAAVELNPRHAEAFNNIGLMRKQLGEIDAALVSAKKAVALAPKRADMRFNLGNVYYADHSYVLAIEAYRAALECDPLSVAIITQLGHALRKNDQNSDAAAMFRKASSISADQADLQLFLGHSLFEQDLIDDALGAYQKAITLKPDFDKAYLNLGMLLSALGRETDAAIVWGDWLRAVPGQPTAQHMLAAASGEAVPGRAQDDYIRELFDDFAPNFDTKLAKLDYRAPQLLCDKLATLRSPDQSLSILDAGCGTGLCGPLLRPFASDLIGVDLSAKMLALAAEHGCYEELVEAELTEFVARKAAAYDVIVVADTLVYFGDLEQVFEAINRALRDGGLVLISLEIHSDADAFSLNPHGRYSHGRNYITSTLSAAGLVLLSLDQVVLRREAQKPVEGWLVVAQHATSC